MRISILCSQIISERYFDFLLWNKLQLQNDTYENEIFALKRTETLFIEPDNVKNIQSMWTEF